MEQFDKCEFSEEVLISRVAHYPELYSLSHPDFKNLTKRQKSWAEIAASFSGNIDADLLSKRWRLLRDSYLRCRRGIVGTGRYKRGQKKRKIWKHFAAMTFIDDVECPSNVANDDIFQVHQDPLTCVTMTEDSHIDDLEPAVDSDLFTQPLQLKEEPQIFASELQLAESLRSASRQSSESLSSSHETTMTKTRASNRRGEKSKDSFNTVDTSVMKSSAELQDEDALFVRCLIPYLKRLPMDKKLELKVKFMQLLLEATKNSNSTAGTCDHCKMDLTCNTVQTTQSSHVDSLP